ncbi:MAG: hypothetical protein IJJ41_03980 [Clostridia bacterium]|nr:hypothetical protein [Clostridia bacterium]
MKKLTLLIPSVLIILIIALWRKSKQLMRWAYGAVGILALFTCISLVKHAKEKKSDK